MRLILMFTFHHHHFLSVSVFIEYMNLYFVFQKINNESDLELVLKHIQEMLWIQVCTLQQLPR